MKITQEQIDILDDTFRNDEKRKDRVKSYMEQKKRVCICRCPIDKLGHMWMIECREDIDCFGNPSFLDCSYDLNELMSFCESFGLSYNIDIWNER